MSDITLVNTLSGSVQTPPTGKTAFFFDPSGVPRTKSPLGAFIPLGNIALSSSITDQAISAATLTLIAGTLIGAPVLNLVPGTTIRWNIIGVGGALGVAANTVTVRAGSTGTVSDAAIATFTTTAGTATASDFKMTVDLAIRVVGAAAQSTAECTIINSAVTTGFINAATNVLSGTMANFNSTTVPFYMHVALTTGASKTATIKVANVELINPISP
jgi:hypothetical protein